MPRAPWCSDGTYLEAARFRDDCLIADGSLITPASNLWTLDLTDELESLITPVDGGTFIENLINQLEGRSDQAKQLAAEALYVAFLFDWKTGGAKLQAQVDDVLSTMSAPVALPDRMLDALHDGGLANLAAGLSYRWAHVDGVLQLARRIKPLAESDRRELLADPDATREIVTGAFASKAEIAGRCLLHLLFPDYFDHVVSSSQRKLLISRFAGAAGVADEPDQDRQIRGIRTLVENGETETVSFYESSLRSAWEYDSSEWDTAVRFALKLFSNKDWEQEEVEYKPEVGSQLALAREAVLGDSDEWVASLRNAIRYKRNNLTEQRHASPKFLRWVEAHPADALAAFRSLWGTGDVEQRIARFLDQVPKDAVSGTGSRLLFATFFLLGEEPTDVPFFKPTAADNFEGRLWHGEAVTLHGDDDVGPDLDEQSSGSAEVDRYVSWCELIDEYRWRILAVAGTRPDRLHAQSAAWTLTNWNIDELPSDWSEQDRADLQAWRDGSLSSQPDDDDTDGDHTDDDAGPSETELPPIAAAIEATTYLPKTWLDEIWALLAEKRQLILYGPPGTGKTFLATTLGEHVEQAGGQYRLVQFHPSYTYEDFFEGYRPRAEQGGLEFDLVAGTFKELAELARDNPETPHVLVIDEINRGNLPKIFGELYFLLEYRNKSVLLQYSHEEFQLPENLYVIGTMNTADKSIALVDAALRRRFYFAGMLPTEEPVKSVLSLWLKAQGRTDDAADLLNELNARIADADFAIGPSYLMNDAANLKRVWKHSILPLLEEHFYSRQVDVPAEYGLDAIRKGLEDKTQ